MRAERNELKKLEERQARRFIVRRRRAKSQQRQHVHRAFTAISFLLQAFDNEPDIQHYAHIKVVIGAINN